jgi:hypothetical protein
MQKPLKSVDGDVIIYLKQQAHSAAERQGIIPQDTRDVAERCVSNLTALTAEKPWIAGWCKVQNDSYWVSVKEPWSDELSVGPDKNAMPPNQAARYWGIVAGAAHRNAGAKDAILAKLTPELREQLIKRSKVYVAKAASDYAAFCSDSRVTNAMTGLNVALEKAQHEYAALDGGRIK